VGLRASGCIPKYGIASEVEWKTEGPQREVWQSEGPQSEGPQSEGPQSKGPQSEGPQIEGAKSKGPQSEGPYCEGPKSEGAKTEGPQSEGTQLCMAERGTQPAFCKGEKRRCLAGDTILPRWAVHSDYPLNLESFNR
jgi:hypothetical protein